MKSLIVTTNIGKVVITQFFQKSVTTTFIPVIVTAVVAM